VADSKAEGRRGGHAKCLINSVLGWAGVRGQDLKELGQGFAFLMRGVDDRSTLLQRGRRPLLLGLVTHTPIRVHFDDYGIHGFDVELHVEKLNRVASRSAGFAFSRSVLSRFRG
jgi:hypothetical protein